jgi:YidC/Oxa1 family membrane protein insertase
VTLHPFGLISRHGTPHVDWLGITDKYWAATLLPDQQGENVRGRFSSNLVGTCRPTRPTYLLDPMTVAPGATRRPDQLFAGAKEVPPSTPTRRQLEHQQVRPA